MPDSSSLQKTIINGLTLYHTGPALDKGPLPCFFYFALSGEDSLQTDPYNQPITTLTDLPIRCFSLTLPFHDSKVQYNSGVANWALAYEQGNDPLRDFINDIVGIINYLERQQLLIPNAIAVGGLSRGGLIATLLAATDPRISAVVGFAPMTRLDLSPDFSRLASNPIVQSLSLKRYVEKLTKTSVRFYIGNRDVRVGTAHAFEFIYNLADKAFETGTRSPKAELIITPSIGFQGHGTSPKAFKDGALWIASTFQL